MALTDQKNKQIIEAAMDEFQERGFAGASMDRISDRAQVSKRTVYNHFESKEVLFRSISDCLADQVQSSLDITFNPDVPIRDELVRLGLAQGALLTDPKGMGLARMMMGELIRDPDIAANMNRRLDMVRVVKNFFDTAVEAGRLRIPDTWVAAEQFLGLIKSRGFYPKLFGEVLSTHEEMAVIIEDTVVMFLNSYGVPGDASDK
ncbi:TetR/AcrR family transcriptional regulator [Roseibium algae]|uniref:TetR/AcrR family transcriptional regulator n=1 Tax=Roseibium algae TaxID=3123038 RepID=A0ABU8TNR9_9HYPH